MMFVSNYIQLIFNFRFVGVRAHEHACTEAVGHHLWVWSTHVLGTFCLLLILIGWFSRQRAYRSKIYLHPNWRYTITTFRSWKYAITIHHIGDIPLEYLFPLLRPTRRVQLLVFFPYRRVYPSNPSTPPARLRVSRRRPGLAHWLGDGRHREATD